MQIGAINSVTFKGNEKNAVAQIADVTASVDQELEAFQQDLEKAKKAKEAIVGDKSENGPKDKNILQTALSVTGILLTTFYVAKRAYNRSAKFVGEIKDKPFVQKILNSDKIQNLQKGAQDLLGKIHLPEKISNSGIYKTVKNSGAVQGVKGFISKMKPENKFATGAAIVGTGVIASQDDGDGKLDITQNVSAFRTFLQKTAVVRDLFGDIIGDQN